MSKIIHANADCAPGDFHLQWRYYSICVRNRMSKALILPVQILHYFPKHRKSNFYVSGRALPLSSSPLLPLETPCVEVWGHTLQLWSYSGNRTGFVTYFDLPFLSADRVIESTSKSFIYVLTNCFTRM